MSCIRSPYKKYMDTLCIHINKQQQLYLFYFSKTLLYLMINYMLVKQ